MKRPFFTLLLLAAAYAAAPATARAARPPGAPADTIVVRLPNQATLTLLVRDAAQLRELPKYHLDSLTTRLAGYINQAEAAAKTAKTEQVTMEFYPDRDTPGQRLPEHIRITTHKQNPNAKRVDVALNKAFKIQVNTDDEGNRSVKINPTPGRDRAEREAHRDSLRAKSYERGNSHAATVVFDLGLNALANQQPGAGQSAVDLRPGGSRYVNIGLDYMQRLGGKRSPLYLVLGPEFAFNNYMLNGNNKWVNQNNVTSVVAETNPARQYDKTKLATASVNLPLMLRLKLHDAHYRSTFSIAAGGFVGYRLASWTKLKYTTDGTTYKDKDHGSYNLEDFQYGLQAVVGYGQLHLFAKYNLNPLFKAGQGPDTQVVSFGLRLFGN
ncbi:porin family protein [Hymenobacter nivis]|uniref:PorT family protein n=1 Tax=Hymenobacter nivis TaxID=1850093 RepID=A0A502GY67_9BACT|nr:porin family protein [Hymenobacter nivis]TPG66140.1 PorT family protein [Hymenobacter nivis]